MNILVIDLGLGGVDILLRLHKYFSSMTNIGEHNLIFYQINYNSININDRNDIYSKIIPICTLYCCDILIIGCHSIAVTIKGMESSNSLQIVNISEVTKNYMIMNKLYKEKVVLFTSPNTHRNGYYNYIKNNKTIVIPCIGLAKEIEMADKKRLKIATEQYVASIPFKPNIVVLACTHYSLIESLFYEALKNRFNEQILIVNPNNLITDNIEIECNEGSTKIKVIFDLCCKSEILDIVKEKTINIDNIQIKNSLI